MAQRETKHTVSELILCFIEEPVLQGSLLSAFLLLRLIRSTLSLFRQVVIDLSKGKCG